MVMDTPIRPRVASAAYYGALVWATYGIAETLFIGIGPWLSQTLIATVGSRLVRPHSVIPISTSLTAFVLVLYPIVGAALSASLVALLVSRSRSLRLVIAADPATLFGAVGSLTIGVAFALNAWLQDQGSVVPATIVPLALAAMLLASAWRPHWRPRLVVITHPVTIVFILVGSAFMAQPRPHLTMPVRARLGIGFTIGALLLAGLAGQTWRASAALRRTVSRLSSSAWGRRTRVVGRPSIVAVALSAVVLGLSALAGAPPPPRVPATRPSTQAGNRPNVVVIVLDTVRADHLSLYGYPRDTTPNLRRMAAAGATLYTNAIASSNSTLASHASIFTGQSPRRHGAHVTPFSPVGIPLSAKSVTLPQLLADQGYLTGGVVANTAFLDPVFGLARGFAYYDYRWFVHFFSANRPYLLRKSVRDLTAALVAPRTAEALFANAEAINDRASVFLESASGAGRPFFLFLNYMDAHQPYLPPAPFDERYPGKDAAFRWSRYADLVDEITVRRTRPLRDREFNQLTSQYDGAIAYLDDQLGRLFRQLKFLNVYDNSLIIVTSDHGEAFGESSIVGHALSVYQHQVHVPLLIKYPGQSTGAKVEPPVSSVDILPTILEAIGDVQGQAGTEGQSLRQIEASESCRVSTESYSPRGQGWTSADAGPSEIALYCGSFKLIEGAGGAAEFYDLRSDPVERADTYRVRAVPEGWHALLAHAFEEGRAQSPMGSAVDSEVLERLRSLGYVR
jgi:arylsulfatase A-like enzyme